jgi:hypothetical protein
MAISWLEELGKLILEELGKLKKESSITPSGLKPAIFRLIALGLNQLFYRVLL